MAIESAIPRVSKALAVLMAAALVSQPAGGAEDCPPARPYPKGIAWIAQNATLVGLMMQGVVGYEGDSPDARPLPQRSMRQHAQDLEASLLGHKRSGKPIHPDALYFTFYAGAAPENEPEAIVISKRDFWCLTRHDDSVLLSDGVNHHTTGIFSVNRKDRAVFILDIWPERFFMLKGRNVRGYDAELMGFEHPLLRPFVHGLLQDDKVLKEDFTRKLAKVKKEQYLKVISALVTIDTPEFIDYFFTINPVAAEDARTQLAFGLTLLHWGTNRFVDEAVAHVEKALELARQSGNEKVEQDAANRLYLALSLEHYFARERGDAATAEAKHKKRQGLLQRYGEDRLVADNSAIDDYRLGSASGLAGDLDAAVGYLTRAIEKDPAYQVAYVDRAVAKARKQDAKAAVEDASKALELNALEREALAIRRAARHPRDQMGHARDRGQEYNLNTWEALALRVRGTGLLALGQHDRALRDGQRLVRLEPENAKGHAVVGFSLLRKGETGKARTSLEQAAARETEPQSLSELRAAVSRLGPPSADDFLRQYDQAMRARDRDAAQSLVDAYPGTARSVASRLAVQGQAALKALKLDRALGAYVISLNILEQIGDELNVGLVLNDMAVAYLLTDEPHAALTAARRANGIFRRHRNVEGEHASEDTLNRLFNGFGTDAEIEAFLQEHLAFAKARGLEEELEATSKQLESLRSD